MLLLAAYRFLPQYSGTYWHCDSCDNWIQECEIVCPQCLNSYRPGSIGSIEDRKSSRLARLAQSGAKREKACNRIVISACLIYAVVCSYVEFVMWWPFFNFTVDGYPFSGSTSLSTLKISPWPITDLCLIWWLRGLCCRSRQSRLFAPLGLTVVGEQKAGRTLAYCLGYVMLEYAQLMVCVRPAMLELLPRYRFNYQFSPVSDGVDLINAGCLILAGMYMVIAVLGFACYAVGPMCSVYSELPTGGLEMQVPRSVDNRHSSNSHVTGAQTVAMDFGDFGSDSDTPVPGSIFLP